MRLRHVLYLAGSIVLLVFALASLWEFALEDWVLTILDATPHPSEAIAEHWEYVATATGVALAALILPVWVLVQAIREREQAEVTLCQREAWLREAARIANLGHYIWDDVENRCIYCDEEYARIFGTTPEEYLATTAKFEDDLAWVHPDDRARYRTVVLEEALQHHGIIDIEYRIVRRDGEIRHIQEQGKPVLDKIGLAIRTIGTIQDITERKRAEEVIREAHNKLEQRVRERTDELSRANRAKSQFLANMSHELRTPLNAIIGFSEVIKAETFGPVGCERYLEYVGDIYSCGQHLLELINDLLDLSKIESGEDEPYEETIDIEPLVQSVIRLVRQQSEKAKVELNVDLQKGLPRLWVDKRKLIQILVNLLSNAVKFTKAGGRVSLKAWCREDSGIVFQVTDTGIGISPADIPEALSQFTQVDGDLDRRYEGTGLGLPLAKALTELHGGSLDLQSQVGVGTTVTVRLPTSRIIDLAQAASSIVAEYQTAG